MGSALGGHAAAEVAKNNKKNAAVVDQVALALPGAMLGGLAAVRRVLAVLLPAVVRVG